MHIARLSLATALAASSLLARTVPVEPRCEHQRDPLAVPSPAPRLSWMLKSSEPARRGVKQTAYRILVASSAQELARDRGDLWDSEHVTSAQTPHVLYAGKPLPSGTAVYWKVRIWDETGQPSPWSETARWRMALLSPSDWHAKWLAAQPDGEPPAVRMPVFRREFRLDKPVLSAMLYVSGLGQYEAHINGAALDEDLLLPGWTNYRKTVLYNAFDVTRLLKPGANTVGVMLGNGMFHVVRPPGRFAKFVGSFGQPKLIAQLRVTFRDGATAEIASDGSWKTRPGPIVFSSAFGGEDFDARLEQDGWDRPSASGDGWTAATEVKGPGGVLAPEMNPPIRVAETLRPVKVTEPKPGVIIYDLGQNFSGWPKITVQGPAGAALRIRPGELLDANGLVTQNSQGGTDTRGHVWLTYTLKGSGVEVWRPRFFYYGFRYVQVEGPAKVLSLEGQFTHSSSPAAGEFSCSKPLFNGIHKLILAAIRSNMQSVLTDCPHREKLGWLEQSYLAGSAVMYNYDVRGLYEKIQHDIWDGQTGEGLVPNIQPEYTVFENGFRDSPEWGSAAVQNPWILYQHYADPTVLKAGYANMARYVRYLGTTAKGGIVTHGLGDWYDVGPGKLGESQLTSLGLTATATYYADLLTLARVAPMAGKPEDAKGWLDLAAGVRSAFIANLYHPETGVFDRGSQTAYAMPLVTGLVPDGKRGDILEKLIATIRQNGNRVTAGDVGFHYVVKALMDGGRHDVLYDMLSRTDSPSYGYQLARGATALTEAWDADPTKSQNHFMLGHAEEWFYRGLAGLDVDFSRPEGERIRIAPQVVGDVTEARASWHSYFGEIAVHWKLEGQSILVDATIPPGADAAIEIPTSDPDSVAEGGVKASQAEGVRVASRTAKSAVLHVTSGQFHFRAGSVR